MTAPDEHEAQAQWLARMFRLFADVEFAGRSPIYAHLAGRLADDPAKAEPLLAAPPSQRRALLLFAAVQYLLRRTATGHPLAAYFPTLGGDRPIDDGLFASYVDFTEAYRTELARLCGSRTTQTNEARRAAYLWLALGRIAGQYGGEPVGLVELGASAGLLLLPDRYGYQLDGQRYGRPDAPPELTMACAVFGVPAEVLTSQPDIVDRTGIDVAPIAADDPAATDWLRACIWPEQTERLARLDAALLEAVAVRPRLLRGEMVELLPDALRLTKGLPVVVSSNSLTYLNRRGRAELVELLDATGASRDLVLVLNEAAVCGVDLFAADRPPPPSPSRAITHLTVVAWRSGAATVEVLGTAGPHGEWIDWAPEYHPYRPVRASSTP
jgi:hypothetical protein